MFSFVPVQYQLAAKLLTLAIVFAAGFATGWRVDGWQASAKLNSQAADYVKQLAAKDKTISDMQLAIKDSNTAVQVEQARTQEATLREQMADKHAADTNKQIGARVDAALKSKATNCEGVLRDDWNSTQ